MTVELYRDKREESVSEFLRRLADCIDRGEVLVRNVATPDAEPDRYKIGEMGNPSTITWCPEIQLAVMSGSTRRLFESLNRDGR